MPVRGLSVFGFWEADVAASYLNSTTWPGDATPAGLRAAWSAARARLGAPIERAGDPEISEVPSGLKDLADAVRADNLFGAFQRDYGGRCSLNMVEIGPLLAIQPHVEWKPDDAVTGRGRALFERCLPLFVPPAEFRVDPAVSGLAAYIRHTSFNLDTGPVALGVVPAGQPMAGATVFGPIIHMRPAWTQVMRIDGRAYLRNGFHRASQFLRAGFTHMAAIVIEADHDSQLQISGFGQDIMRSDNPPTMAHFAPERATEVQLKQMTKLISVSWAGLPLPEMDPGHAPE